MQKTLRLEIQTSAVIKLLRMKQFENNISVQVSVVSNDNGANHVTWGKSVNETDDLLITLKATDTRGTAIDLICTCDVQITIDSNIYLQAQGIDENATLELLSL